MGGLFAWATGKKEDDPLRVLQPNQPAVAAADSAPSLITSATTNTTIELLPAEQIPTELKNEVKENISPENTITASSIKQVSAQQQPAEKVIFELGDDGEDEEEEEEPLADEQTAEIVRENATAAAVIQQAAGNESDSPVLRRAEDTVAMLMGIGHIARDSLSIMKGVGANTSQDSMRSLDSLPEFEVVASGKPPATECIELIAVHEEQLVGSSPETISSSETAAAPTTQVELSWAYETDL